MHATLTDKYEREAPGGTGRSAPRLIRTARDARMGRHMPSVRFSLLPAARTANCENDHMPRSVRLTLRFNPFLLEFQSHHVSFSPVYHKTEKVTNYVPCLKCLDYNDRHDADGRKHHVMVNAKHSQRSLNKQQSDTGIEGKPTDFDRDHMTYAIRSDMSSKWNLAKSVSCTPNRAM